MFLSVRSVRSASHGSGSVLHPGTGREERDGGGAPTDPCRFLLKHLLYSWCVTLGRSSADGSTAPGRSRPSEFPPSVAWCDLSPPMSGLVRGGQGCSSQEMMALAGARGTESPQWAPTVCSWCQWCCAFGSTGPRLCAVSFSGGQTVGQIPPLLARAVGFACSLREPVRLRGLALSVRKRRRDQSRFSVSSSPGGLARSSFHGDSSP